jgi:hypothetical protein
MKTAIILLITAAVVSACQSPQESPQPNRGPISPDIGTPSNYRGSAVTSPQM